ncbi:pyridoxamine 5'-phosphate oxidase-domain-containing protein, partial [Cladorrhinum sp. PSN332]
MSLRLSHLFRLRPAARNQSRFTNSTRLSHTLEMPSEPAPWRTLFLTHLTSLSLPTFTLATLHPSSSGSLTPRARTCVLRGLLASLPSNPKNPAPLNPANTYESDFPVFTTDTRMEKIPEISSNSQVEAVFWIAETKTQWRIRGTAHVLSQGTFKDVLQPRMRKVGEGDWDVEREVTAHFGNLSPAMRGSFKGPAPGRPRAEGDGGLKVGEKVEDLEDEIARRNFRVVVIVPEGVDQVLLEEVARRWVYAYRGQEGKKEYDGGEMVGQSGWERVE